MRAFLLAVLFVDQCAALQLAAPMRSTVGSVRSRSASIVMGEMSTKKENEWKYVKSVNDFGKEQTYMFLAAKDGDANGPSASLGRGLVDLGDWSFLTAPYFIALFTPLALCAVYVIPTSGLI